MKQPQATQQSTRVRIQELGASLRSSLAAVLQEVGGPSVRPVALAKSLKLDDSLAARLLRSVRASDPLSTLRELPAPQGLRLFLDAAGRAGVPASVRTMAEAAVHSFETLIDEMPLGRASLDTAIDGWLPSGRAKAERGNKQLVFKAFSQTLGFTIDTCCFATVIQPSAAGDCCDAMTIMAMDGITRLREGAPILLFGHTRPADPPGFDPASGPPRPYMESLDGEREVIDARKFLLREVGRGEDLPVRLIERPNHARIVLESSVPPINVPITAAVGYITRNSYLRYQAGDRKTDVYTDAVKVPLRVLVQDIFLHEDCYPSFIPEVVARMDSLGPDPLERDEELLDIDRLDLDVEMVRLGWGLGRVGIKEWAGYEPLLRSAFERSGWDSDRFRAFRCYVKYPFPFVSLATWFDLPPAP